MKFPIFSVIFLMFFASSSFQGADLYSAWVKRVIVGDIVGLWEEKEPLIQPDGEAIQKDKSSVKLKDEAGWSNWINKNAKIIGAIISSVAILTALFLGLKEDIRKWWYKPKLKLYFENGKEPYCHKISFNRFETPIEYRDRIYFFRRPGFNSRVKIVNEGKTTARNVQVIIEKVEVYDSDNKITREVFYHPTRIKWSGEMSFNPVDIIPESPFFLDVFHSQNETLQELIQYNYLIFNGIFEKEAIEESLDGEHYINDIYWNVWVESPDLRGIPSMYLDEGIVHLFFIINAENVTAFKFKAVINWVKSSWDAPQINFYIFRKNDYTELVLGG